MNCSYCQHQKTDLLLLQLTNMIEDAPPQLRINRARGLQAKDLLQIQSLPPYKARVIFQTQLLFSRNQLLFNKSLSSSTTNTSFPQSKLNLRSHIGKPNTNPNTLYMLATSNIGRHFLSFSQAIVWHQDRKQHSRQIRVEPSRALSTFWHQQHQHKLNYLCLRIIFLKEECAKIGVHCFVISTHQH